ncbi:NAD(P)-dependent oxidoreductase [Kordiimonas lacus]|uniref:dihydrouracil dehydrogenase (NAD(+)) n=1 Tax=Kordiimonas lacus TaxID=637679 RepID=A0A1G7D7A8_9PROT|nr:NAD(P)-dependent oxidoreductase [Kordiimonas lacus]SDE47452.1 glutamate synthase (NADPH/NADH) small chain [Kordiimonas lacus]
MTHKLCGAAGGVSLSDDEIAANFGDLHKPLSQLQAMQAADHCIYCYDAPCITACPTSIDIPTFIHQIRTRNTEGAAKTILSQNIMGGTCARACPTEVLCEQACVRNHGDEEPVEIGLLQRFAVDHLMAKGGEHPFKRAPESGKRIAVVGAGPAGLSCAHRAAMLGHNVTVFEAKPKSGGLNEYGLAAYKMVDDFAQREVDFLMGVGGIEIKHGQALGKDISLRELRDTYGAVFLGVGLGDTNKLGLDGEDKGGVLDAIQFIEDLRQESNKAHMKVGKHVVVIGGGNTAIDAAVQSRALGAEKVTLVYRRGEEAMSATGFEIELARTNGVTVELWAQPVAIHGNGHVASMVFERTAMDEKNGTLVGTGETFEVRTDMVLKAIGQKLDGSALDGLDLAAGKVSVLDGYATSLTGVFAGGDCVKSGEDLTVQAVEDGKQAAHAIDEFLKV